MSFWKPGTVAPGSSQDRDEGGEIASVEVSLNPNEKLAISEQRKLLPIFKYRRQLLYLLETHRTVVIVGETGCGKTTQIPQYLHESGWTGSGRAVVCTQPRRVAASSVANRVAQEMNVRLGAEVGYAVRFEDKANKEVTRIKFVTDGMLVRETMRDPLLSSYSVIMIDEAHERSLYTDLLLGLLKQIMRQRKDLRLIVASATLDAQEFARFFNTQKSGKESTSAILSVEGRMHPVDIHYLSSPVPDYITGVVDTIFKIHTDEPLGDILVFLTGQDEVDKTINLIDDRSASVRNLDLNLRNLPLYSTLPSEYQARVFQPTPRGTRKVIVSTNIAETSITIPNIVYVIDAGFMKLKAYNAKNGVESLIVTPTSKASSVQRAGRAGRVKPGKCYRLYPENVFTNQLIERTPPAMQRTNLAMVCLQLKALGIDNIVRFDFLSPPPAEALIRAMDLLFSLGAIDKVGQLTVPLGEQMVELPLDPKLAKMLLVSPDFECGQEILTIAAMLQLENCFLAPPNARKEANRKKMRFAAKEGDHITLLNLYKSFEKFGNQKWCYQNFINHPAMLRAKEIRAQILKYLKRFNVTLKSCHDNVSIRKNIVAGYFANAARLRADGYYETVREKQVLEIHPSSVLFDERPPAWITFNEVVLTNKEYARDITVIESSWLPELAPHFYENCNYVKVDQ